MNKKKEASERYYGYDYDEGIINNNKMSEIVYDEMDGEIIYADYTKLEEYIDNSLINNAIFKKNNELYVRLSSLKSLDLSDNELAHAIHYLGSKGINVKGKDTSINYVEFNNYICITGNNVIKSYDRLSDTEYTKLFELYYKTKDINIKKTLIEHNLGLVAYTINLYQFDINDEDLVQNGYLGLTQAIDKYNPLSNVIFTTFAVNTIKYKILHYTIHNTEERNCEPLKISYRDNLRKIKKDNCESSDEEIKDKLLKNMYEDSYLKKYESKDALKNFIEIKTCKLFEDLDCDTINKLLTTASSEDFESKVVTKEFINKLLDILSEKERHIINLKYGIDNNKEHNNTEISKIYNMSREAIRQRINKILKILKEALMEIEVNESKGIILKKQIHNNYR